MTYKGLNIPPNSESLMNDSVFGGICYNYWSLNRNYCIKVHCANCILSSSNKKLLHQYKDQLKREEKLKRILEIWNDG